VALCPDGQRGSGRDRARLRTGGRPAVRRAPSRAPASQSGSPASEETRPDDADPEILGFDRALYAARREIENAVSDIDGAGRFYVCSLDRQRVVYKGLLKGSQLAGYYPDLTDERFASHVALVHARFSTNTLGAWHLAHPYRNIVHNGEFNTIRGNVNWMRARENDLDHPAFGAELDTIKPVIDDPNQSDTASVDNAVELSSCRPAATSTPSGC